MNLSLDLPDEACYTEENTAIEEVPAMPEPRRTNAMELETLVRQMGGRVSIR